MDSLNFLSSGWRPFLLIRCPCSLPIQPSIFHLSQRGSQAENQVLLPKLIDRHLSSVRPQASLLKMSPGCIAPDADGLGGTPPVPRGGGEGEWERWAASEWGQRRKKKRMREKGGTALLLAVCLCPRPPPVLPVTCGGVSSVVTCGEVSSVVTCVIE